MPDPHAVAADWAQLRDTPADFDGHSRLIDSLIAAIDEREPLGQACRTLEDVARLRGLCVLASNQGGCTPGLQARLMSLCRRLGGDPDVELKRLIGKLERGVIHAQQPRLSPPQCFALITPLIDARLRSIQQRLQHDSLKGCQPRISRDDGIMATLFGDRGGGRGTGPGHERWSSVKRPCP